MSWRGRVILIVIAIAMIVLVLDLLRRRRLGELASLWWINMSVMVIVLMSSTDLMTWLTHFLGAEYPASALTMVALALVIAFLLFFSITLWSLSRRMVALTQALALLEERFRKKMESAE